MEYDHVNQPMTDDEFDRICKEVASGFGYEDISGDFEEMEEHKIKWTRSFKWIKFHLSDWYKDAPVEMIGNIIRSVLLNVEGEHDEASKLMLPIRQWSLSKRECLAE
jgi:hypothetical protein